ncbi:hypothetical protein UFOVP595_27 [uncultured Caudovirales phage]|uniref:Uncharacterized protein n=1 Tax=uncultured Caudovirales phage TaxID=2100421 RepID=A0A6J5N088_9CAUD|nr:hypothetical protein UFOVP595_27 [uncultured Caudovirales phage]
MKSKINYQKIWNANDFINRSFFAQIELKYSIQEAEEIASLQWNKLNLIHQIKIKEYLNK